MSLHTQHRPNANATPLNTNTNTTQHQQQPKKKPEKKYADKGAVADEPLDDPVAEKLRRQRLEEEADFRAARDLFGGGKPLEELLPKTLKDFESYAEQLTGR